MRALVTGAAGFIGSRLAERLAGDGHHVICLDALTPYYDPAIKRRRLEVLGTLDGVELVEADLRTVDLAPIVEDVAAVFHFAAQPGVRASWSGFSEYAEHNLLATHRLLASLSADALDRFVFASSSSVYGQVTGSVDEDAPARPYSPYGVTKLAAEALCRAYAENFGLPVVSLRLFTVYGPGQRPDMAIHRLISASLRGEEFPMFGDGSQSRAFTYVDDVVDAAVAALDAPVAPGSVFNIAGATTSSLNDVIAAVGRATGQAVRIDRRHTEAGDVERTDAVVERAWTGLHWRPSTPLELGIARQVADVRARLAEGARR